MPLNFLWVEALVTSSNHLMVLECHIMDAVGAHGWKERSIHSLCLIWTIMRNREHVHQNGSLFYSLPQKSADVRLSLLLIPLFFSPTDEGLEGGTAEQLSTGLARASPELRKCVASCKHIAETTRQQNNFQNVSFVLFLSLHHTSACRVFTSLHQRHSAISHFHKHRRTKSGSWSAVS